MDKAEQKRGQRIVEIREMLSESRLALDEMINGTQGEFSADDLESAIKTMTENFATLSARCGDFVVEERAREERAKRGPSETEKVADKWRRKEEEWKAKAARKSADRADPYRLDHGALKKSLARTNGPLKDLLSATPEEVDELYRKRTGGGW